jgi:tetraprenyl-beta-curcumene synthase
MAWREFTWGLPATSAEVARWRLLAEAIPDRTIRADALHALERKRGHADGAAMFAALPKRRNRELLRLLVGYEIIFDFLDDLNERHPTEANGRELHRALVDALDIDIPIAEYYRHHPFEDDGGYLATIVETCRRCCRALPSYERVRSLTVREAQRAQVLALNHLPDPLRRNTSLIEWAKEEHPHSKSLPWFELTGAASASFLAFALLALASRQDVLDRDVERTCNAYWPWMELVGVMLDSYADQAEDTASGHHSYVSHYQDDECMVASLCRIITEAARHVTRLPHGDRHAVILASMIGLYLSKDSSRVPHLRPSTRRLIHSGGFLTRILAPIVRTWRVVYSLQSA